MTRQTLFLLAIAAALAACGAAPDVSNYSQRSIDADIAAARDVGPTAITQNPAQITFAPQLTVPLKNAY